MRPKSARIFCAVMFLVFAVGLSAQKRSITEKDLFQFVWVGDPQVSPDGTRVAFVRVTVNEKKDGYDTAIWTVPTSGGAASSVASSAASSVTQPLTSGNNASSVSLASNSGSCVS